MGRNCGIQDERRFIMLSWGREEVVDGGGEREGNERDAGLRRFSPDNPGETTALSLSERPSLQKKYGEEHVYT